MKQVAFKELVPLIEESFSHGKTITISVTGVSMVPTLLPRDAVTLHSVQATDIRRGDILLYRRKNGMYVLHRVVNIRKNRIDFCGDAQYTVEKNVPVSSVIARVCSYEKDGQTFDLEQIRKVGYKRLRTRRFRRLSAVMDRRFGKEEKNPLLTPHTYVGGYIKRHLKGIALLCVLSGITAAATLGMALVSGRVIDKVVDKYSPMNHFLEWFLLLLLLLVAVVVSNFVFSNLRARLMTHIKNEIREDLFEEILGKRFRDVQSIHSGEIINRFTSDVSIVADNVVSLIPQVFSLTIKLFGGLAFMLVVDVLFTSFILIGSVVIAAFLHFFSGFYKRLHKECQEAEGKSRSFLQECVENLIVVKSFNNEKGVLHTFSDYQEDAYHKQVRRVVISSIGNSVIYSGFTLAYYGALAWGIFRVAGWFGPEAVISLGTFMSLLQVVEQIRMPFRSASGLLPQYYSTLASAERLQELILLRNEKRSEPVLSLQEIYARMQNVGFDHVSFAYVSKNPIFKNSSVAFRKGELSVIVGPSGSGKTTMIKLLLGLVTPQEGVVGITIDDGTTVPINAATRKLFSYVPQGNMILSGTIEETICFGNDHVTEEDIKTALRLACLEDTIRRLPHGLQSVIGERGVGLSEGQIQRLAIARALLSRSPILLLDECTSALDAETEKQLIANLKTLRDHTILFISHRTAVLDNADAIFSIDPRKNVFLKE